MANEVFISYSRSDYQKVRRIKETIDREVGIDCWMDLDGIESDKQFVEVIISAINSHDTILFMMSETSMKSKWALDELAFAEKKHKRIVLVRLDKAEMPDNFYFLYHSKDQIDWSNKEQRTKLLNNLSSWFLKTEVVKKETDKLTQIYKKYETYIKIVSFIIMLLTVCRIFYPDISYLIFSDREYYESTEPDSVQTVNPSKCPVCEGTGMVVGISVETGNKNYTRCSNCAGTGVVTKN